MTLLNLNGIVKDFPGVRALDDVSMSVQPAEVHALVGENGAGKSTLLKILGGLYEASSGNMDLRGQPLVVGSPRDAHEAGVSVIHQEFNLVPDLTVAENIWLGQEPRRPLTRRLDKRAMRDRSKALLGRLGVEIDPAAEVSGLSVSAQQMVEIAKALTVDASVIVMDEPTAALDDRETDQLFTVIDQLRADGKGIIYVSHRLAEVFRIADRVTVLRDGQSVGTVDIGEVDEDQLIRMMVGRDVDALFQRTQSAADDVVWESRSVSFGKKVEEVSLELRAGEILGLGGIDGCGSYEFLQGVFGILPATAGSMTLRGKPYAPPSPREALSLGIGFLSRDRKATGIFPDLSLQQNVSVATIDNMAGRLGMIDRVREDTVVDRFAERLGIRFRNRAQPVRFLSGGNQQKALIARVLAGEVKVLLLAEPTRGVDVGAKGEIHELLNELTSAGLAVLMLSSDLPELLGMSDRIVVMHDGRVTGRLSGDLCTEDNVVAAATGRLIGVEAEVSL